MSNPGFFDVQSNIQVSVENRKARKEYLPGL